MPSDSADHGAERRRRVTRKPQDIAIGVTRADGSATTILARCRIDTPTELECFRAGGILAYVLRKLAA